MKKKIISMLLALSMVGSLAACGTSEEGSSTEATTEALSEFVYLPEYIDMGWDLSEEEYMNDIKVQGTTVMGIAQGWDHETGTSSMTICEYDLESREAKKIPLKFETDNINMNNIMKNAAGEYIALMQSYDFNEETGESSQSYVISVFDATGASVSSVDFTAFYEELKKENEYVYFNDFVVDAEGNLYMESDQTIYVLNPDGTKNFSIEASSWINSMGMAEDGRVYYTSHEGMASLTFIDVATKGKGETFSSNAMSNMYNGIQITADMKALYSSSDACSIYDFAKDENTDLFDWIDVDIIGSSVRTVTQLTDGSFAAIYEEEMSWEKQLVIVQEVPRSEAPERKELVLATMDLGWDIQKDIVDFNKTNSEYRIKVDKYFDETKVSSDYSNYQDVMQDGITLLMNDLTGKNPPDMIEIQSYYFDIANLVDKGVLEEITPYLEEAGYKDTDFVPSVLEACKVDGGLYYIPQDFTIQTMFADANIVGDEMGWTITEVMDIVKSIPDHMEFMQYGTKSVFIQDMVLCAIDSFIDPETNEAKFDTDEFKALLELANTFPVEYEYDPDGPSEPGAIRSGDLLLYSGYIGELGSIVEANLLFGDIKPTAIGFPGVAGSGAMFSFSSNPIAITASSEYKDAAADFMVGLLEPEEESEDNFYYRGGYGFPALQADFDARIARDLEPRYILDENGDPLLDENGDPIEQGYGGIGYGDVEIELRRPTQEEADLLLDIIANTKVTQGASSSAITELILTEAESYFSGQKSVDEVAGIIQNRVSLYLIENS